ncbi:galactokinase [Hydrotalea sp.]|uniref:galactokinase n=1 Tax=Hydrotalea sp. TaxID=2881279 RepID=UPI002604FE0D|nr:galactokinase [Hydrotalea sp.]
MANSLNQIIEIFKQNYTETPAIFFSPGRLNLIGEHIDYNDGFVLPAAINRGIWIAIQKNNTDVIHCIAADVQEKLLATTHTIQKQNGWRNYILGVLHVLQQDKKTIGGFHCVFGGNLPQGAGLSSSAAIEAGLLFALNKLFQLGYNPIQLALFAQLAEHSYAGVECGIMDMFANLFGKNANAILLDCVTLEYKWVPFALKDHVVVLINSNVHHSLASGEYNKRRAECNEGLSILSALNKEYYSFRNILPEEVKANQSVLPDTIFKRCLYVTEEIQRVQKAVQLLKQNNIEAFGELLYQTHEGLSKLYAVSCPEIDFIVNEARKYPKVIGARLMGGGFGGTVLCIMQKKGSGIIAEDILAGYQQQFNIVAEAYFVQAVRGTHQLLTDIAEQLY